MLKDCLTIYFQISKTFTLKSVLLHVYITSFTFVQISRNPSTAHFRKVCKDWHIWQQIEKYRHSRNSWAPKTNYVKVSSIQQGTWTNVVTKRQNMRCNLKYEGTNNRVNENRTFGRYRTFGRCTKCGQGPKTLKTLSFMLFQMLLLFMLFQICVLTVVVNADGRKQSRVVPCRLNERV